MLLVNLVVTIPDVFKLFGRNAITVIRYLNENLFAVYLLRYNNSFVFTDIIDCIVYKIIDYL